MAPSLLPLTPVMLGTMTFGKQIDEQESHAQLDEYVKMGGVWLDTAELYPVPPATDTYGITERIIGNWLAKDPSLRSKVGIATKVTGPSKTQAGIISRARYLGVSQMEEEQDFTPAQIEQALECSLKRLQTDYVDLYQLHWPSRPVPLWGMEVFTESMVNGKNSMRPEDTKVDPKGVSWDSIVATMGKLIKEGKILSWGLSNETPMGVTQCCEAAKRAGVPLPITIQNDFCLLDRRFDGPLAEACSFYNVKLLAYGPLAGGTLTGKYQDKSVKRPKVAGWRHDVFPKFQERYYAQPAQEATAKYVEVAKKHSMTPVELALGFCATRYYMGSTIFGANSVETMVENFKAVMDGPNKVTQAVMEDINKVHMERPNPNAQY